MTTDLGANLTFIDRSDLNSQFSYARLAASGLTYEVLKSTTHNSWTEDVGAPQVAGAVDGNGAQTVVVTLRGTIPIPATKLCFRVAAN